MANKSGRGSTEYRGKADARLKRVRRKNAAKNGFFDWIIGFFGNIHDSSVRVGEEGFIVRGGNLDYQLFAIVMMLLAFGIVMVYSASAYEGYIMHKGASEYFVKNQGQFMLIGLVAMWIVSHINENFWRAASRFILFFALMLVIFCLIKGTAENGSKRWLEFGPIKFQPSEFAKPAIAIYMSERCSTEKHKLNDIWGIISICIMPVILIGAIAIENLSSAILPFVVMMGILIVASDNKKDMFRIVLLGVIMAAAFILAQPYRRERIMDKLSGADNTAGGTGSTQTLQSLYAIGSGGWFGKGLGNSAQKNGHLSECYNDFIFSIICEELGIFGAIVVIVLFMMLFWKLASLAKHTTNEYNAYLIVGILSNIASQTALNMAVATDIAPNTGVTLPFISHGGSSLLVTLISMGLVFAVTRKTNIYESVRSDRTDEVAN